MRSLTNGLLGCALAAFGFASAPCYAQSATAIVNPPSHFDIPAQALQTGLIEFALQAGITILVDDSLLQDLRTNALAGPLHIDDALAHLLANTPLGFHYDTATHTYTITRKTSHAGPDELVITGLRYPFRYQTIANSQQTGNNNSYDSSRYLNLIPQSLLQDTQAATLGDALKYASGITPGDGVSDSNDDMFIRGFQRHAVYVDGFRLGDYTGIKLFPANTERVDILKGPATLLYGQAEAGGIVNVVRKKPQDDNFTHVDIGGGNLGRRYASLDINGQLPLGENINVRLVAADDSQDVAGEMSDLNKQLVAPSLSWKISDNTSLDLGYEYQTANQTWDRRVKVLRAYEDLFPGANLSDAAKQKRPDFASDFNLFNAELHHYFSPDWHLTAKYFWHREYRHGVRTTADAVLQSDMLIKSAELGNDFLVLMPGNEVAIPLIMHFINNDIYWSVGKIRSIYDENSTETGNNASVKLEGSFTTGTMVHHLTTGTDWHRQDIYKKYTIETRDLFPNQLWSDEDFGADLPYLASIVFDPTQPLGRLANTDLGLIYNDYGIYLQDSIDLNDKWTLSLGGRHSIITGDYTDFDQQLVTELQTQKKFSAQLGLAYQASENHSIYLNYSQALRANYHIDELGNQPAKPELSDQKEVGVKSQLFDGRLLTTVALFDINKKNITELQMVDGLRTLLAAHKQQVRGLDVDFTWQASPRLNVIGAASFIDPKIISGTNAHKTPMMVADQTASVFANYAVTSRLNINSGVNYVSQRFGDNANQFPLAEFTTVDLGANYSFMFGATKSTLSVCAKNLLDTHYYTAILGGTRINQSDGRTLVASVKLEL